MMPVMMLLLSSVLGWVHVYGTASGKTILIEGHAPMTYNANGHWTCNDCDAFIFEQKEVLAEFLKRWIVGDCTLAEWNVIARYWYCGPAAAPVIDDTAEPEPPMEVTRLGMLIEQGIDVTQFVKVTPFGKRFHGWGCAYAASGQQVTLLEAVADGKDPCHVCQDQIIINLFEGFGQ